MAFVLALCLSSTEGKSDAPTHLLFGSSFLFYLFVITEAFHISYPDQTELVSYLLS